MPKTRGSASESKAAEKALTRSPGAIGASAPRELLRDIAAAELDGAKASFAVFETDGTCALLESGPEWSGQLDERTRQRFSADAVARLQPIIEKFPSGVWVCTVPVIAGGRAAGTVQLASRGALPETAERRLRAAAHTLAVLVERIAIPEAPAGYERELATVIAQLPVSVAFFSGPRHILEFSNPARIRLWGGRNALGKPMVEGYPELTGLAEAADRVFRTGEPFQVQSARLRIGEGIRAPERRFDVTMLPRYGSSGEVAGVLSFGIETTDQERARGEVERERAFVRAVLDQMPSGVMLAEAPSGKLLLVNEEGERLLREPAPRVGSIEDYGSFHAVHEDGRPYRAREYPLARALEAGEIVHQEDVIYRRGDGSTAVLAVNAAPIRDDEGRILAGVCTYYDVTERRKERDALRRQSRLIDLSHDAIISASADRIITGWNQGAEETYGWTASEAIGKLMHTLLRTRGGNSTADIDAVLLQEYRWEGELRHSRKDGAEIVVESCQALVQDDRGRPAAILEINRDITARKRAEGALRDSEQWLRYGQQVTGVGIGDYDFVAGKQKCSEQFYRLFGFEPEDPGFDNDALVARIHPDDRQRVLARAAAAREGGDPFEAEFRVAPPGVPERWLATKATVFFDGGRPVRAIAAALDITERKRSEQAHYNAQQLESVGMLAAGIAHDFNNLLTGILGNASLLLPDMDGDRAEQLQAIMNGAQKAAELTRQLLAYAGKGRFVVRAIDLADVVRDMTDLLRVSIPRQVEVRRELHPARVTADAGQLQQVVLSLVMNAAEAVGEGCDGSIVLSTGVEQVDAPLFAASGDTLPAGLYAYLEVADSGCGMDEATCTRVFDPFFTTKFLGRGMGLAAVAGIMRSHKGGIRIETAPGKGSTFRVLIPSAQPAPAVRKASVLVVDDEETVREFIKRVLEGRGFEVLSAANGREALAALDQRGDEIRLVVLDAVMPVMGGGETLSAIRARRPDQRVLLTSGYSEEEVHRLFGLTGDAAFIQKPYTAQQLAERVKEVLES